MPMRLSGLRGSAGTGCKPAGEDCRSFPRVGERVVACSMERKPAVAPRRISLIANPASQPSTRPSRNTTLEAALEEMRRDEGCALEGTYPRNLTRSTPQNHLYSPFWITKHCWSTAALSVSSWLSGWPPKRVCPSNSVEIRSLVNRSRLWEHPVARLTEDGNELLVCLSKRTN